MCLHQMFPSVLLSSRPPITPDHRDSTGPSSQKAHIPYQSVCVQYLVLGSCHVLSSWFLASAEVQLQTLQAFGIWITDGNSKRKMKAGRQAGKIKGRQENQSLSSSDSTATKFILFSILCSQLISGSCLWVVRWATSLVSNFTPSPST